MKTLITVMLTLIIAVCIGQSKNVYIPPSPYVRTHSNLLAVGTSTYSTMTYHIDRICSWKDGSDTLEILPDKIKFIKIDGKVFEIKREVKLEEVHKTSLSRHFLSNDSINIINSGLSTTNTHLDTIPFLRTKIKNLTNEKNRDK